MIKIDSKVSFCFELDKLQHNATAGLSPSNKMDSMCSWKGLDILNPYTWWKSYRIEKKIHRKNTVRICFDHITMCDLYQ